MNTLCVICARTGSSGLKKKNFLKIRNKSLILHTVNTAIKSKIFKNIIISVDKKKINLGRFKNKVIFLQRPKNLAKKNSIKLDAIRHAVKYCEAKTNLSYDDIIDLDVSSPLRTHQDVRKAFKIFKNKNSDNLFSVTTSKKNPYFNMVEIKNNKVKLVISGKSTIHNRQKAPKTFDMNASIYIWKKKFLFKTYNLFNKKTSLYFMPPERSIDIDSIFDFKMVKYLLK